MSIMTSCQHSKFRGFTATASCFVGRRRNRAQVRHSAVHFSTSVFMDGHHTILFKIRVVWFPRRCPPNTPTCACKNIHLFHVVWPTAVPSGTAGTHVVRPPSASTTAASITPSRSLFLKAPAVSFSTAACSCLSAFWANSSLARRPVVTSKSDSPASARASSRKLARLRKPSSIHRLACSVSRSSPLSSNVCGVCQGTCLSLNTASTAGGPKAPTAGQPRVELDPPRSAPSPASRAGRLMRESLPNKS